MLFADRTHAATLTADWFGRHLAAPHRAPGRS